MKFNNGYWMLREGVTQLAAQRALRLSFAGGHAFIVCTDCKDSEPRIHPQSADDYH